MSTIFKIIYVNPDSGELGRLPDLGIINAGGVVGPTFTVGGKSLLFADGSASDGSTNNNQISTDLQRAYDVSTQAVINLAVGKDFVIKGLNNNSLSINASTGRVSINLLSVNGVDIISSINLIQNNITSINSDLSNHLNGVGIKHKADEISTAGPFTKIVGANVEEALASIDTQLGIATSQHDVLTYEYLHPVPAEVWIITHNHNSYKQTISIYGTDNVQVWADDIRIIDANTAQISFSSPQSGRALVLSF